MNQPDIWNKLVANANLYCAFRQAARGKRSKPSVAFFELNLEDNLFVLQEELHSGSYSPGQYSSFFIHDPKKRLISAAPFRDRVVHHALCNRIEPLFEKKFIYHSYANRIGKGTHRALEKCSSYMRTFRYVLPMDIQQYFPCIDHEILLSNLSRTIHDERVLDLCARILASGKDLTSNDEPAFLFSGDSMFSPARPRGLPIGNLTSQFWANVYLNPLDHFIKRELKCKGYIRYVDDMLLFAHDKATLHLWRAEVIDYLSKLRLKAHEHWAQPRPVKTGISFLGFQVFSDYRRLKRRKVIHTRRRLRRKWNALQRGELDLAQFSATLRGWLNHARYADTWGLRCAFLSEFVIKGGSSHASPIIAHLQ